MLRTILGIEKTHPKAEENHVIRTLIICTPHKILLVQTKKLEPLKLRLYGTIATLIISILEMTIFSIQLMYGRCNIELRCLCKIHRLVQKLIRNITIRIKRYLIGLLTFLTEKLRFGQLEDTSELAGDIDRPADISIHFRTSIINKDYRPS